MAFERPTLTEIIRRVQADAESRLGKKVMRWSLASVMTRVISGVSHGSTATSPLCSGSALRAPPKGTTSRGVLPSTASTDCRQARAVGTVTFTGTGVVPAGTQLQNERGAVYVTTDESQDGRGSA